MQLQPVTPCQCLLSAAFKTAAVNRLTTPLLEGNRRPEEFFVPGDGTNPTPIQQCVLAHLALSSGGVTQAPFGSFEKAAQLAKQRVVTHVRVFDLRLEQKFIERQFTLAG